jgi:hypothetical protein
MTYDELKELIERYVQEHTSPYKALEDVNHISFVIYLETLQTLVKTDELESY